MVVFACSFPNTISTKHHTINCIPVICMYILSNKAFSSLLILVFYYQRSEVRDPPVQLPRLTVAVLLFSYNRRKLDELPFHYYQLKGEVENSPYIADITWIYDKVCGSNCYQILEDINLQWSVKNELTLLLRHFIETHASVLNYDGRQFYSHLYKYLEDKIRRKEISLESNDSTLAQVYSLTKNPPVLSFIPLNSVKEQSDESGAVFQESSFDLVVRLPETDQFVVSVSTNKEEICVWDVKQCTRVRILKGVPHPTNLIPIDQFRCIVLCRRELRIYDLNSGTFVTKLKGVMNQKMPYFGLHDQSHLVALSRNRMYVNLMNLETGEYRLSSSPVLTVRILQATVSPHSRLGRTAFSIPCWFRGTGESLCVVTRHRNRSLS
jgi:hypothetical protein